MKNSKDTKKHMPDRTHEPPIGYRPRVVIKFHDDFDIPYEDGIETTLSRLGLAPWEEFVHQFGSSSVRRAFTLLTPQQIRKFVAAAQDRDPTYSAPNLLTYFVMDSPPGSDPREVSRSISSWPAVETAYFDSPGLSPNVHPDDDYWYLSQGYLDAAPDGIDAKFAWPRAGGMGYLGADGAGQNLIDLEKGWELNHPDLAAHNAVLLPSGSNHPDLDEMRHGTRVLGVICAVDNTFGCVGIAPNLASVNVLSHWDTGKPIANTISAALLHLNFGDVLLLEVQIANEFTTEPRNLPVEARACEFDAIRLVTALGIVVVEAAGNSLVDLDCFTHPTKGKFLKRSDSAFRDSGAIVVAAAGSEAPHARRPDSNYGSRIDCYAWGHYVTTCDSGNSQYTGLFGGTSAASAIIAGAALSVQGMAEQNLGYRFGPGQLRAILRDINNGTDSKYPALEPIGVMPDLRKIITSNALNLAPDVYIRDFVGDTGDPHSGAVSSSPDIILRNAQVADPQASFGEGSGNENSNSLGSQALAGQDNFIYVRVRNRGGSAATNVTVTISFAPPATLVTPALWTEVGQATLPTLPAGNVLTVAGPITWPAAEIPATGHYCFVGLIGMDADPAPDLTDFLVWDNFVRFIRVNNNVTWRNFNVVDNTPVPMPFIRLEGVPLPFLAPGAPDQARWMQLELVANLPDGARVWLEAPLHLSAALREHTPATHVDEERHTVWMPANPYGRTLFNPVLLGRNSKSAFRVWAHIPEQHRNNRFEIYVRQLHEDQEVGRITWRLSPPAEMEQLGNGKKANRSRNPKAIPVSKARRKR